MMQPVNGLTSFVLRHRRWVLVPALIGVLGGWNWYLPAWLGRILLVPRSTGPLPMALTESPDAGSGDHRPLVGARADR